MDRALVTSDLDSQVRETNCSEDDNAYGFLMLPYCRIDNAAVEQDLRCVGNSFENPQGFVELLGVVMDQGLHPGFNFLVD